MTRRPTIHDVAASAGVSKSLVSLALRGSPAVADTSKELILKAAAELGYRPNAAARSLADRHSRTVGVLILDLHNPVFAEILDGVHSEVRLHGYNTLLVTGGVDPKLEESELNKLLEFNVEGLVPISHRLPMPVLRRFAAEVPTVVVTRPDSVGPRIDTVSNDDTVGSGQAVQHLVSFGHRSIAHLSGGDNPVSLARERGYLAAMTAAGLGSHTLVVGGGLTEAAGHAAAVELLRRHPTCTAVTVANDLAALGALAAAQEEGRTVPGDLSVVGYDGIALGAIRTLSLTTVAQPLAEIGTLAARRLFSRIAAPRGRARHLGVAARLVARGSTGPAPSRR